MLKEEGFARVMAGGVPFHVATALRRASFSTFSLVFGFLLTTLHLTASAGPSMEPSLYSYVPFSSPGGRRTAVGERACSASSSVRPPRPRFPLASGWLYADQFACPPSVLLTVDMGLHARTIIKGPSLMLLRSLASHH